MRALSTSNRTAVFSLQYGSTTGSFDCSEEFSLDHWIRVFKMVNESESADVSTQDVYRANSDQKLNSEVESTTADEYFARNVV